jgi:hypothetical protein
MSLHTRPINSGSRTERREHKYIFIFNMVIYGGCSNETHLSLELSDHFLVLFGWIMHMSTIVQPNHSVPICSNAPALLHRSWCCE